MRAAELAADLGQRNCWSVRRLADVETRISSRVYDRVVSRISRPPMINDPAKIPALIGFAAQAQPLARRIWQAPPRRAAQHCWWSNASGGVRSSILAAASRLSCRKRTQLVAITAYAEPLQRGGDVYVSSGARREERRDPLWREPSEAPPTSSAPSTSA
jgi:hypothetical protein